MKNKFILLITFFLTIVTFSPAVSMAQDDVGVLVLAHGGGDIWNQAVIEAAQPLEENYEVEVAFGMANYVTISRGLKSLEKKGVDKVVVVPLFISSYSPIITQTQYLLGKRDSLTRSPLPVMHDVEEFKKMMGIESSEHHSSGEHKMIWPEKLPPISTDLTILMTEPLNDHPVAANILHERIQALSKNPSNETIVLVAHGPTSETNNKKWIHTMENLAAQIQQKKQGEPYKQIFALTVRDDASDKIYKQAKVFLRTLVRQAGHYSRVIVIPLYLSQSGREKAVAKRLEGIDFVWSGRTLLPDPAITDFLRASVEEALSAN